MPRTSDSSTARVPAAAKNSDGTGPNDALSWLEELPTRGLPDALGIKVTELTAKRVVATMPVDNRTRQPFGILHGGASVALAETVASLGAVMNIDRERSSAVGVEINANHLRAKSDGVVTATGVPIHVGRSTQVWEIRITDESGKMVCISRCTLAVVPANVGTRQAST
jgi:1,4-dihydroxy-2-naphthoyl-CoA hydrolase